MMENTVRRNHRDWVINGTDHGFKVTGGQVNIPGKQCGFCLYLTEKATPLPHAKLTLPHF